MTQPFGSGRPGCVKVYELRDEALRVPKEHSKTELLRNQRKIPQTRNEQVPELRDREKERKPRWCSWLCTDSEKHCSDTSTLHGDDARDGGGEFVSQARPDKELEATRRKFRLNEQALSKFASVLARRSEAKKRRHDAAIRKWSIRLREG